MTKSNGTAPKHLRKESREFFKHLMRDFDLGEHHIILATKACEALDRVEEARAAIKTHDLTYTDRFGAPRARPEVAIGDFCEANPWSWSCGFYPGSIPGECTAGTASTFEDARAAFLAAWEVFLSKRTEVDFEEWGDQRDWTEWKYAAWARGEGVLVRTRRGRKGGETAPASGGLLR